MSAPSKCLGAGVAHNVCRMSSMCGMQLGGVGISPHGAPAKVKSESRFVVRRQGRAGCFIPKAKFTGETENLRGKGINGRYPFEGQGRGGGGHIVLLFPHPDLMVMYVCLSGAADQQPAPERIGPTKSSIEVGYQVDAVPFCGSYTASFAILPSFYVHLSIWPQMLEFLLPCCASSDPYLF